MAHSHVSFSDPAHRGETVWSGRLRAISWASELKNQTTNQITRIAHVIHTWLYNNVLTHPTLCPDPLSLLWVWSGNAGNETSSVLQTSPYLIQFVYIQVCIRVIACETKQRNMFWWVVGLRGTVCTLHYLLHMCSDVADNQCNCAKWANYSFFGTHAPWHAHLLTHSPEDVCILLWVCEWPPVALYNWRELCCTHRRNDNTLPFWPMEHVYYTGCLIRGSCWICRDGGMYSACICVKWTYVTSSTILSGWAGKHRMESYNVHVHSSYWSFTGMQSVPPL